MGTGMGESFPQIGKSSGKEEEDKVRNTGRKN